MCGGCALQHWREESYLAWKRALVSSALQHAGIETEIAPLSDAHGEGRRRAVLHARRGEGKEVTVGFAAKRSHAIVPIEQLRARARAETSFRYWAPYRRDLSPKEKPLDLHFTATDGGLDLDVRGSGPIEQKMTAALARIASEQKLVRLTRHGEIVTQLSGPP